MTRVINFLLSVEEKTSFSDILYGTVNNVSVVLVKSLHFSYDVVTVSKLHLRNSCSFGY